MSHRYVRRGTAVLTLTLALALAGAGPAAAAPRRDGGIWSAPWSWLVRLWAATTGVPVPPAPGTDSGEADRGAGLDPDGRR
jgi:hypothetical protein